MPIDSRVVSHLYRDPLDEIWMSAAKKIGFTVARTEDAFAHSDGVGGLHIASAAHLDADDSLAQMVFHEICHSLVEGHESFALHDWGLDNTTHQDDVREHAACRVQAYLADQVGLRKVLAPTTDFRHFYDALPSNPLSFVDSQDTSALLARPAIRRASTNPWWPHLGKALEATAAIINVASQWPAPTSAPSLYRLVDSRPEPHPTGLPGLPMLVAAEVLQHCGDCAWQSEGVCQQAEQEVDSLWPACSRFETPFDCQDCGACCRGAYHSVTITEGDGIVGSHPKLLIHREGYSELRRIDDHCAALGDEKNGRYECQIYADRPTCCREFENAGRNCITARRRLGFSL